MTTKTALRITARCSAGLALFTAGLTSPSTRQWRSPIREPAHPLSIGSAGSFAHSPIDPS